MPSPASLALLVAVILGYYSTNSEKAHSAPFRGIKRANGVKESFVQARSKLRRGKEDDCETIIDKLGKDHYLFAKMANKQKDEGNKGKESDKKDKDASSSTGKSAEMASVIKSWNEKECNKVFANFDSSASRTSAIGTAILLLTVTLLQA